VEIADGHAERRNALQMLDNSLRGKRRITLGADKGYGTRDFAPDCRARKTSHRMLHRTSRSTAAR
jgi:hypothetical protein